MFLAHFGLAVNPFGISPRLDFLYRSAAFEESMAHLVYGLENSEAIIVISGAIGTGKTMAVQSFLERLGSRYVSALVTNTSVDGKELLKLVLEDLNVVTTPGADKSDLIISLKNLLHDLSGQGQRIVIVIDEAQNLSREVLEEVRLLTNLGQGDDQPIQVVLVGQPELDATLLRHDLAQLRQRVRVHYRLAPLSRPELDEYVDHRMRVAGGMSGVFGKRVLDLVYERSGGVPRVVNTLCSDALLSAYVAGRKEVAIADVDVGGAAGCAQLAEPRDPTPTTEVYAPVPNEVPARENREGGPGAGTELAAVAAKPSRGRGVWWGLGVALVGLCVVASLFATGRLRVRNAFDRASSGDDVARTAEPARAAARPDSVKAAAPAPDSALVGVTGAAAASDSVTSETAGTPIAAVPTKPEQPLAVKVAVPSTSPNMELRPASQAPKPASTSAPEAVAQGPFYIHVSSFHTTAHAQDNAREMEVHGVKAIVREHLVGATVWYRVLLGPFDSRDEAIGRAADLRGAGVITYFQVVRLAGDPES